MRTRLSINDATCLSKEVSDSLRLPGPLSMCVTCVCVCDGRGFIYNCSSYAPENRSLVSVHARLYLSFVLAVGC